MRYHNFKIWWKDSSTLKVLKMQFVFGWAYDKKLILWSGDCFLILFALMDAIFWNCDISVGAEGNICFFGFSQPVYGKDQFPHKISNGYRRNTFFMFQGRCAEGDAGWITPQSSLLGVSGADQKNPLQWAYLYNNFGHDIIDLLQWCSEQTEQVLFIGVKWPFSKGRGRR